MKNIGIDGLIFVMRGQRIMLDADLAALYGVAVKQLKRQVRRNIARFPPDFLFLLTQEEHAILRCQFGALGWGRYSKYLPYAFTEQGVAMLSGALNSSRAVRVNIEIMRAFVRQRRVLAANRDVAERMKKIEDAMGSHAKELGEHAAQIQEVFSAIRKMMEPPPAPRRKIGFVSKDDRRRAPGLLV